MSTPSDMETDHRDGNGLNNQRENLRICTRQQNSQNGLAHKDSSSQFKGVSLKKGRHKWVACIMQNGKLAHLGYFDNEIEAAKTYNTKAKELFGEFAKLNIIKDD